MEKEQEKLRDEFVSETGGQLDAVNEGANVDIGFSDAYVYWLENRLLLQRVEQQRELLEKLNEIGVFKNTDKQIELILNIVNY